MRAWMGAIGMWVACSPEGGRDPDPAEGCDGSDVTTCLEALGLDVDVTSERLGPDGKPLPDDYAPLGAELAMPAGPDTPSVEARPPGAAVGVSELFALGIPRPRLDEPASWLELDPTDPTNTAFTTDVLRTLDVHDVVAAARGDVDGDGRDEVVLVSRTGHTLRAATFDDRDADFAALGTDSLVPTTAGAVAAVLADLDGDGRDELVVAAVEGDVLAVYATGPSPVAEVVLVAPQSVATVDLAVGNVDLDAADEVGIVLNEIYPTDDGDRATSTFAVMDDARSGHAILVDGPVVGAIDGVTERAALAGIGLGDVDQDGRDEIVLGGVTGLSGGGACEEETLLVVLEDALGGTQPLAAAARCVETATSIRIVHVDTLDVDGDQVDEIAINGVIYDGARTGELTERHAIDDKDLFGAMFDGETSAFATADVTNDGREDLIAYSRSTGHFDVWGIANPGPPTVEDPTGGGGWRRLHAIETTDDEAPLPFVLDVNVDSDDTTVVKLSPGSHQLVYTEPVIIAVLAAAPCYDAEVLGQDTGKCTTSYGLSETSGGAAQLTTTVSAGVGIVLTKSFEVPVVGKAKVELTGRLLSHLGSAWASSYEVSKTVTYTTAPLTDEVVFTSIPYDIYTYTVVTHPDPEVVGERLVVSLPRDLITYKVPLSHYAANTVDDAPLVEGDVFTHTPGDPSTYPTVEVKDARVADAALLELAAGPGVLPPELGNGPLDLLSLGDKLDPATLGELVDLEVGPAAVNPGGGTVTQSLTYRSSDSDIVSGRTDATARLKVTVDGGLLGGLGAELHYGVSTAANFTVLHGSGTTFSGTVSDIPESNFEANGYQWGLFTYLYRDPSGQQFDVVHYWVE